jgi:hypothetical protein
MVEALESLPLARQQVMACALEVDCMSVRVV